MENVLKKVKLRQVDWMPRVKPNDFKDLGLTPEHRSLIARNPPSSRVYISTDKAEFQYNDL